MITYVSLCSDGALERQDIDIEEKRLSSLKENAHEDNG